MSPKILVIEDDPTAMDLIVYLLRAFGHQAMTASSGGEGLEVMARELPDLVLCDILMAGIDGYEVARRVKGEPRLRDIPLIAVTALAMVGDRDRMLASGFDGYVPKPIAPETFVSEVEKFLRPEQRVARKPEGAVSFRAVLFVSPHA